MKRQDPEKSRQPGAIRALIISIGLGLFLPLVISGCNQPGLISRHLTNPVNLSQENFVESRVIKGQVLLPMRLDATNSSSPAHFRISGLDLIPPPRGARVTFEDMYGSSITTSEVLDDEGHYRFTINAPDRFFEEKQFSVGMVVVRSLENKILVVASLVLDRKAGVRESGAPSSEELKDTNLNPVSTLMAMMTKSAMQQGQDGAQFQTALEKESYAKDQNFVAAANSLMEAIAQKPDKFTSMITAPLSGEVFSEAEKVGLFQDLNDFILSPEEMT